MVSSAILEKEASVKGIDRIWDRGVLCQIQGGVWSMEARLHPSDINVSGDLPEFVKLGSKKLLPAKVKSRFLNTLGRARNAAERYGFPFFINGSYFVPFENFEQLKECVEKERGAFFGHVDAFIDKYAEQREEYLETYSSHKNSLIDHYPSVEYVRSRFKFEVVYYAANITSVVSDDSSAEDMYLSWAVSAMNSLREEARQVADAITSSIDNGTMDGRSMRRVQGLIERVSALDMLDDEDLRGATMALAGSPSKFTANQLKNVATDVNPMYVRRVLLDD